MISVDSKSGLFISVLIFGSTIFFLKNQSTQKLDFLTKMCLKQPISTIVSLRTTIFKNFFFFFDWFHEKLQLWNHDEYCHWTQWDNSKFYVKKKQNKISLKNNKLWLEIKFQAQLVFYKICFGCNWPNLTKIAMCMYINSKYRFVLFSFRYVCYFVFNLSRSLI